MTGLHQSLTCLPSSLSLIHSFRQIQWTLETNSQTSGNRDEWSSDDKAILCHFISDKALKTSILVNTLLSSTFLHSNFFWSSAGQQLWQKAASHAGAKRESSQIQCVYANLSICVRPCINIQKVCFYSGPIPQFTVNHRLRERKGCKESSSCFQRQ